MGAGGSSVLYMGQLLSLTGKINEQKVSGQIAFYIYFFPSFPCFFFNEEAHNWTHAMHFIDG